MKRHVAMVAAVIAAAGGLAAARAQAVRSDLFDAGQLLRDLRVLSADDMAGRRAGTPGGLKARAYIVERFKASGLAPFGASYEHGFQLRARKDDGAMPANVVGRIEGTANPGRYIVVTAHYDHLGVGSLGVHNGANDNASGTAALVALAAHFRASRPKHSIIFAALDAEESGLEGARAFVREPPVPAAAMALNVNMDMIGRDPADTLYVAGTHQQPFLKPFVQRVAARAPVKLVMGHDDPAAKGVEDWTRDSDHYAFCQAKIPCLYFGVEDFGQHHKVTDDYETMTHAFYVRAVETLAHAIREFDADLDAIAAARVEGGPAQGESGMPIELPVAGGKIAGTLLMPPQAFGQIPVALIIAGSGPTDRDGNSPALPGKNNMYRLLAEALAAQGIASVRYDKRGLPSSMIANLKEADLRFEHFVNDASAWITRLRNDARFSKVAVIGHSEGSLIGMLAARAARADAFVSVAGIGRRASDVLRDQLRPQLSSPPELWKASETILAAVEAGRTSEPVPPVLASLYRIQIQPYLISWFAYTPSVEFARLAAPSLIIQGTTDLQVTVAEAEVLKAARPDATLRIIDGMNHVLKAAPLDRVANIATYTDPAPPLVAELPAAIAPFIHGVRPPRHPATERRSLRTVLSAVVDGARIAIEYGQPSKRDRAIWGALVPWDRWWMPGADEGSVLTTSAPLTFGTLAVPAGDYTIYTLPGDAAFSLIINGETNLFHTEYRATRDIGRVPMTLTRLATPVELLTFAIDTRPDGGGVLRLRWDDREYAVPFTVGRPGR
jgi:pimeloyl-ACP methyl ester carboxylesterase